MIPRALARVFSSVEQLGRQGWSYTLHASMVEVHNEELSDLLVVAPPPEKNARPDWDRAGADKAPKLDVKHDDKGTTTVVGATVVEVRSQAQVEQLLAQASAARSVGKTACNERSSRSHMVFTLKLEGRNAELGAQCSGVLNLIDLAGSERLSRSQVTGDRLKETQAINKSLSALGDVISAIATKEAHVPYRNSKLTYLLSTALGGNSKALMLVNVSPARESAAETLCSLRFAAKARTGSSV